ncbi:hypothetical protein BD779DRAFT_252066 [Infundibulicybe gibba]|nr:hypothetical protein BD779DRAFT_252066 [Infundibulicybe gibba]
MKADQFDKDFCGGWNSEIDSLLTFAGLFSAVVTAFTIESYKLLQTDPQDITNHVLLNLSAQIMGRNSTTLLHKTFTPSASSLRINVLWFLSLTFSLTSGLVGILCKQWLRHYEQDVFKPPREALAMRQFRYEAFLRCRVMEILSALPVLLGLGLILFFVGLIDFLRSLSAIVSIPVTILIGATFAFLVITTLAPAFQYAAAHGPRYVRCWYKFHPPLFAFKSPQSLAILHLVTWLYPLSTSLKVPNWASLELRFFSESFVLKVYTGRALTWLDETYSHSQDIVHQICLCLQDVAEDSNVVVEDIGEYRLQDIVKERSSAAVINLLFNATRHHHRATLAEGRTRRDIIATKYLCSSTIGDQYFAALEHLIRALNSSHHKISSLESFDRIFRLLSLQANGYPVEQAQELIWQRAILFRNLLSEGRWGNSTGISMEVQNIFENLEAFTDEDLNSIFNALCAWINQLPRDAELPSHCWTTLTSILEPHRLDEALRHRPPVHNLMAFLDSRLQMGDGVKYLCSVWYYYGKEGFDSFFKALYAWIERNPQDTQSFINCWTLLTTIDSRHLRGVRRRQQSFRDFEAFLEAQISGDGGATK